MCVSSWLMLLLFSINQLQAQQACDTQLCQNCDVSMNSCLQCKQSLNLFNGYCIFGCPDGYYQIDKSCDQCEQSCAQCVQSKFYCTKCSDPKQYISSGKCVNYCNTNQFVSDNQCIDCLAPCKTCQNSPIICLDCIGQTYYLQGQQCVLQCSLGFYPSNFIQYSVQKKICQPCQLQCAACISQSKCTSCKQGLVLYKDECISNCPDGFYENSGSKCLSFLNASNQCPQGQVLVSKDICSDNCPDQYYYNVTLRYCRNCPKFCPQCKGQTLDDCLSCQDSCRQCTGNGYAECQVCKNGRELIKQWNKQEGECACFQNSTDNSLDDCQQQRMSSNIQLLLIVVSTITLVSCGSASFIIKNKVFLFLIIDTLQTVAFLTLTNLQLPYQINQLWRFLFYFHPSNLLSSPVGYLQNSFLIPYPYDRGWAQKEAYKGNPKLFMANYKTPIYIVNASVVILFHLASWIIELLISIYQRLSIKKLKGSTTTLNKINDFIKKYLILYVFTMTSSEFVLDIMIQFQNVNYQSYQPICISSSILSIISFIYFVVILINMIRKERKIILNQQNQNDQKTEHISLNSNQTSIVKSNLFELSTIIRKALTSINIVFLYQHIVIQAWVNFLIMIIFIVVLIKNQGIINIFQRNLCLSIYFLILLINFSLIWTTHSHSSERWQSIILLIIILLSTCTVLIIVSFCIIIKFTFYRKNVPPKRQNSQHRNNKTGILPRNTNTDFSPQQEDQSQLVILNQQISQRDLPSQQRIIQQINLLAQRTQNLNLDGTTNINLSNLQPNQEQLETESPFIQQKSNQQSPEKFLFSNRNNNNYDDGDVNINVNNQISSNLQLNQSSNENRIDDGLKILKLKPIKQNKKKKKQEFQLQQQQQSTTNRSNSEILISKNDDLGNQQGINLHQFSFRDASQNNNENFIDEFNLLSQMDPPLENKIQEANTNYQGNQEIDISNLQQQQDKPQSSLNPDQKNQSANLISCNQQTIESQAISQEDQLKKLNQCCIESQNQFRNKDHNQNLIEKQYDDQNNIQNAINQEKIQEKIITIEQESVVQNQGQDKMINEDQQLNMSDIKEIGQKDNQKNQQQEENIYPENLQEKNQNIQQVQNQQQQSQKAQISDEQEDNQLEKIQMRRLSNISVITFSEQDIKEDKQIE